MGEDTVPGKTYAEVEEKLENINRGSVMMEQSLLSGCSFYLGLRINQYLNFASTLVETLPFISGFCAVLILVLIISMRIVTRPIRAFFMEFNKYSQQQSQLDMANPVKPHDEFDAALSIYSDVLKKRETANCLLNRVSGYVFNAMLDDIIQGKYVSPDQISMTFSEIKNDFRIEGCNAVMAVAYTAEEENIGNISTYMAFIDTVIDETFPRDMGTYHLFENCSRIICVFQFYDSTGEQEMNRKMSEIMDVIESNVITQSGKLTCGRGCCLL